MELDVVTAISAVSVAAYAAIAIGYAARFEFSPQEIRGAAILAAVIIAAFLAIDFLGKKLRKAK